MTGAPVTTPKPKAGTEAFRRDYTIRREPLSEPERRACTRFIMDVEAKMEAGEIQQRRLGNPCLPGDRGLLRFATLGKMSGDWRLALQMLKPYCSQEKEMFEEEWKQVETCFNDAFSLDANGAWKDTPKMR